MAVPLQIELTPKTHSTPELYPLPTPERPARMRVADVVVHTLRELGVDCFYGIPGGAICSVYDALIDQPEVTVVNTRQETGAVFMAMGHSRAGGNLPCVLVTSGPGVTNAITGLAAANADGIPLIVLAGEVPRKNFGRGALQEGSSYQLDVLGMVRSVTKFAAEISNARSAAAMVRKAVATARSGRQGPVFLSLPLDVASELVPLVPSSSHVESHFDVDEASLERAAAELQTSRRGMILVGSGARHPDAVRLIGALAATLQVPVATTPKAKGVFPEDDPLSLGVFGHGGHPSSSDYLEKGVDVLLCIGCGLGEPGTNSWSPVLQPSRSLIQIDIDGAQIGKNYQVDCGLVGPAHRVLAQLLPRLKRRSRPPEGCGIRYLQPEVRDDDAVPLKPGRVLHLLQGLFPADTIFTADIGEHMIFALHYLRVTEPDGFIVNSGLGSMGSGIGAAIGAKLAAPRRQVVSICGDHGFQMQGMELATCVQHQIGVVFAIFNDARMRMVESGLTRIFGRSGVMDSHRTDFAALARSMGAHGFNIERSADFATVPEALLRGTTPVVLDITIDPAAAFAVHGRVAQIKSFSS